MFLSQAGNKKLFVFLFIGFVFSTVLGTIMHEFGHYIVAKLLGYNAKMGYMKTSLIPIETIPQATHDFLISIGGPLQTMLTGTLGLILLYRFGKSFCALERLSFIQWTLVFVSFFWLRQTRNFCAWLTYYFLFGAFYQHSDEVWIADFLNLPQWLIFALLATIGIVISGVVLLKFIPNSCRIVFTLAALIGTIAGTFLWMKIGPFLMP